MKHIEHIEHVEHVEHTEQLIKQLITDITLINSLESYFNISNRIDTLSYFNIVSKEQINNLIDLTIEYYLIFRFNSK